VVPGFFAFRSATRSYSGTAVGRACAVRFGAYARGRGYTPPVRATAPVLSFSSLVIASSTPRVVRLPKERTIVGARRAWRGHEDCEVPRVGSAAWADWAGRSGSGVCSLALAKNMTVDATNGAAACAVSRPQRKFRGAAEVCCGGVGGAVLVTDLRKGARGHHHASHGHRSLWDMCFDRGFGAMSRIPCTCESSKK
jgi:hypothetical protein